MMDYPLEKYRYIVHGNEVIAISRYAGKKVVGKAKCSPDDSFNVEFGKKLAAYRCNLKICEKRLNKARNSRLNAAINVNLAKEKYAEECEFYIDCVDEYNHAVELLKNLEDNIE